MICMILICVPKRQTDTYIDRQTNFLVSIGLDFLGPIIGIIIVLALEK